MGCKRIIACVLIAAAAVVCGSAIRQWLSSDPRLNLILVTLDTTRADRLGCYGYEAAQTPTIDALARRGVVFDRAYTPVPLTLPAHASILTGLYPFEHGLFTNGHHGLPGKIPTLAEVLASRGYATGAFVASFVLNRVFGVDRGFDTYDDDVDGPPTIESPTDRIRSADQVIDRALAWLNQKSQAPFFCWVHLFDPHANYLEHKESFGDKFLGRPYDAEIAYMDVQLKRLLDFVDARHLTERTMIVVVGDHGEGLAEHRERWHGYMLYNSTLRVPMIVSIPLKAQIAHHVAEPVSLIDISPTVLDCLDVPCHCRFSGRTLKPALIGETLPAKACYGIAKEVLLEEGWSPLSCLITTEWKYIHTAKPELYDLLSDPGETNNLSELQTDKLLELQTQLINLEASGVLYESQTLSLSEQDRKRLTGMGYFGASAPVNKTTDNLPDLKDKLDEFDSFQSALELIITGKAESAIPPLYQLISSAPRYLAPRKLLAQLLLTQEKVLEAESQYLAILDIDAANMDAHMNLGKLLLTEKQYVRAHKHLLLALKSGPDSADLQFALSEVLNALGRRREAMAHYQSAKNFFSPQQKRRKLQ